MKISLWLLIFFSGVSAVPALGDSEKNIEKEGIIRVVGNEPFPEVILVTENDESYLLSGDLVEELFLYQHQTVRVSGKLSSHKMFSYAGTITVKSFQSSGEPLKMPSFKKSDDLSLGDFQDFFHVRF